MSKFNDVDDVLHRVRVELYPNYLPKIEGRYIARTNSESVLGIEEICATLYNRGGFTGNYGELLENIRQFFKEAAYQLCDGYAVNMKYFSVHPNIGGTFNSVKDDYDSKKNPIGFRFRIQPALRELVDLITVEIEGLADTAGWIDEFIDTDEEAVNTFFVPGDQFILNGSKIRIAGDDPACGMYFVPVDNPSGAVKVTRIAENNPSKIIGVVPQVQNSQNRIEIRTQYAGSTSTFLKAPRAITSTFVIEEV